MTPTDDLGEWSDADATAAVGGAVGELQTDGGTVATTEEIDAILDELERFDSMDLKGKDPDTLEQYFDVQDRLVDAIDAELNEDHIPDATHIWWIDEAEFHLYCAEHYHPIADEQWTGFSTVPDPQAVKEAARERLEAGALCEKCHSEALYGRRDELLEERGLA